MKPAKSSTALKHTLKSTLLVLAVAASFFGHQAHAQATFRGGLAAGFAATQVHGDAISGFNKLGLAANAFVTVSFSDALAGRMEIGYVGKGSRKPANPDAGDFTTWGYTFHYVEVPLLLEYHFDAFFVQGGPYAAILIAGQQMNDGVFFDVVNPEMEAIDIGVAAGIGFDLTDHLSATARYTTSLTPIRKAPDNANITRFYDARMANIVVQFMLSYTFGS